jgi:hypothetical protein
MANKTWLLALLLLFTGSAFADGQDVQNANRGVCKGHVEEPQQCRWIDGSVAIHNGTPSVRIRQHGSKRTYAVGPSEQELMPLELKSKLTISNTIDAKLKICPLTKQKQAGFRTVCIDEAKILKVTEIR